MPTIIALDVGLSMDRCLPGRSEENSLTYLQLAAKGISQLLDFLTLHSKLEYVSLVTFASQTETKVDFTRDYELIKQAAKKVESEDITCPVTLFKTVLNIFSSNWGTQTENGQLVVFTNCSTAIGDSLINKIKLRYGDETYKVEYKWIEDIKQYKLGLICVGIKSDIRFYNSVIGFEEFFTKCNFTNAKLYVPKSFKESSTAADNNSVHVSHKSTMGRTVMFEMVDQFCEENYKPYETILKCGKYFRLECPIIIWPAPQQPYKYKDFPPREIPSKLEVSGYLALSDVGSPASISRHLILPKVEREKTSTHSRRNSDKSNHSSSNNNCISSNNYNDNNKC